MARSIVGEFLRDPEDLNVVWPDKKISANGDTQACGPDGIKDPKLRRELWGAAGELMRMDLQRGVRDPRDIQTICRILSESGFALAGLEESVA